MARKESRTRTLSILLALVAMAMTATSPARAADDLADVRREIGRASCRERV